MNYVIEPVWNVAIKADHEAYFEPFRGLKMVQRLFLRVRGFLAQKTTKLEREILDFNLFCK